MPLTGREIALIRESYAMLEPRIEDASVIFYEKLFEVAPELRGMFRGDIGEQGMKLMTAITAIIQLLDAPDELRGRLRRLGQGHAALGVAYEHFQPFGTALGLTLDEVLGARLSADAACAWKHAYAEIAVGLLEGINGEGSNGGTPPATE